ncbi:MAG: hypothetical protein GY754_35180, partial [bacterium]|nr:hypothetical protein [bacterium]
YAAREGVFTVWIYPDSGKLMQIRPQRSTFIIEADKLIMEDIQRWSFDFPKKVITPTKFDIKYRVVLRKKLSDKEILEEVGKRMNDE